MMAQAQVRGCPEETGLVRLRQSAAAMSCAKACLQTGFPNRSKIDSRLKMEISLDSIDVERGPMGPDRAGAVGQSQ
jgi:hypothetical protein